MVDYYISVCDKMLHIVNNDRFFGGVYKVYSVAQQLENVLCLKEYYKESLSSFFAMIMQISSDDSEAFHLDFDYEVNKMIEDNKSDVCEFYDDLNNRPDKMEYLKYKKESITDYIRRRFDRPLSQLPSD